METYAKIRDEKNSGLKIEHLNESARMVNLSLPLYYIRRNTHTNTHAHTQHVREKSNRPGTIKMNLISAAKVTAASTCPTIGQGVD